MSAPKEKSRPVKKKPKVRKCQRKNNEPDWITGDMCNYHVPEMKMKKKEKAKKFIDKTDDLESDRVQQDDLMKPVLEDIVHYGLNYAYKKYTDQVDNHDQHKYTKTSNPKTVIIIGAGMAGLSAAYELTKVGHNVKILEMQTRAGGRVKTLGEKDGFAKHCYADAGAMRLPDKPDSPVKMHFLTDFYAETEFGLKLLPFNNSDDNAWLKFYDEDKIKIADWNKNADSNFTKYWPGWDERIIETNAKKEYDIHDIDTYYLLTTNIVCNQLRLRLRAAGGDTEKEAVVWDKWVDSWSKFSLANFLQNTRDGIYELLEDDHHLSPEESDKLDKLIPWPEEAMKAFSVFSYTEQLDQCLVQYLRDQLAEWWSPHMHRLEGGMSTLTEAFIAKRSLPNWGIDMDLQEKITFNSTVNEIWYGADDHDDPDTQTVTVKGYYTSSEEPFKVRGDAVIITVPLHLIRHIKFIAKKKTTPPDQLIEMYKAVEDIWQGPATKIMIQCSDRFWEKQGIRGGFSKTNLPIGQIHYPTYDENAKSERGILMCYTWKSEALSFAALQPEVAIHEAVRQLEEIHPKLKDKYEVGAIQAWSNDTVGAYTLLKPYQYSNVRELMMYPVLNMFFAGDGISFSTGWIQGALLSGLRAAYQFYSGNEDAGSS